MSYSVPIRTRRNRRSENLLNALAETELQAKHLVLPLFIQENHKKSSEISSMPGMFRRNLEETYQEIESALKFGICSFALFVSIDESKKNPSASEALNPDGLLPQSIFEIKKRFPDSILFSDVALDPFNSDGHDGLVKSGKIINDETVALLCKMSLVHAQAGVDYVAPSDMMDGRIKAIRQVLDEDGFSDTGIMSYTAKYCSSLYGPFREALDSAPKAGNKKTYQMDFRNYKEALLEAKLDHQEGADIMMVKPAGFYLDVIKDLSENFPTPIAAYQVSGEYAMLTWAAKHQALDLDRAMLESLFCIRRAGAQLIFTYFAKKCAELLKL